MSVDRSGPATAHGVALSCRQATRRKDLFFEKKRHKTSDRCVKPTVQKRRHGATHIRQEIFGSFFKEELLAFLRFQGILLLPYLAR
jgi:hypothetical protein